MLLALDTSTRTIGVALYNGVSVLGETIWSSQDYHTVELAPKVAEMLSKCNVKTPTWMSWRSPSVLARLPACASV